MICSVHKTSKLEKLRAKERLFAFFIYITHSLLYLPQVLISTPCHFPAIPQGFPYYWQKLPSPGTAGGTALLCVPSKSSAQAGRVEGEKKESIRNGRRLDGMMVEGDRKGDSEEGEC